MLNKTSNLKQQAMALKSRPLKRLLFRFWRRYAYMKVLATITLFLFSFVAVADGEYPSKLEGTYYLWGDPIDKNDLPGVEGFTIFLSGEAAERLFKKIEQEALHNECWDDGTVTKYAGNVECSLSPKKEYSCSFSVNLKDQKIYRAEAC